MNEPGRGSSEETPEDADRTPDPADVSIEAEPGESPDTNSPEDDRDARLEAHPRFERMRPEDRLGEGESLVIFVPRLRRPKPTERP
jgi:hypothetical protein